MRAVEIDPLAEAPVEASVRWTRGSKRDKQLDATSRSSRAIHGTPEVCQALTRCQTSAEPGQSEVSITGVSGA